MSIQHKELFEALCDPEYENFALSEGTFLGERATFLGSLDKDDEFHPIMVFLDDKVREAVEDAEEALGLESDEDDDREVEGRDRPATKRWGG